jgi:hypothetical protein
MRLRPSPAMAVALIALFVALGGTYDAYFTLDAPASVALVCGGGEAFWTGNHAPSCPAHGRCERG